MLRYVEQRLFEDGIPSKSTMFLVKEDFRLAGELMSMSIIQDGQASAFLASAVFKYLSDTLDYNEIDSDKHKQFCENVSSINLFLYTNLHANHFIDMFNFNLEKHSLKGFIR